MKSIKLSSIKNKFFYAMFLSSSLIISIVCAITICTFISTFIKEQKYSSYKNLEYINKQLEFFMTSTKNYTNTIITSEVVQYATHKYKENQNIYNDNSFIKLKNEINHIIQSTPYIHSVSIYGFNGNFLISTSNTNDNYNITKKYKFTKGKWISTEKPSNITPTTKINTFSYICPFFSYSTGEHLGYLEIAILEDSIYETYSTSISKYTNVFITGSNGYIKSAKDKQCIGIKYPYFDYIDNIKNDISYNKYKNSIFFTKYVPNLDWYIISETSTYFFFKHINIVIIICLIVYIISIIIYIILSKIFARTITLPLSKLIEHTKEIKKGKWSLLKNVKADYDVAMLLDAFNSMVQAQEQITNKLLNAQSAKDKIALELLQEQINPHFLYNTLDNICSLAEINENETLINMVMNLSTFYRRVLNNGKVFITIKEELELTEAYLHILQIRYFNKFDFKINCSKDLLNYSCLKLLLQPIVENSIYHGIKEINYKGFLNIDIFKEKDNIILTIKDNGIGIDENKINDIFKNNNKHFGIKNIDKRIKLYYGNNYGLTIKNNINCGCITTIYIKKLKEV